MAVCQAPNFPVEIFWEGHEKGSLQEERSESSGEKATREQIIIDVERRSEGGRSRASDLNSGDLLHVEQLPVRPISMGSFTPQERPRVPEHLHLHPGYLPNASRSSHDIASVSEYGLERRSIVAPHRQDALPTVRASARGITRVASRATVQAARSRSHSRVPSPASLQSTIELPYPTTPVPGSQQTMTMPTGGILTPIQQFPPQSPRNEIYPIMCVPRYDRGLTIEMKDSVCMIPATTTSFSMEDVPVGWVSCTHPAGALYFYHPERRIYTDANICDQRTFVELIQFADLVYDMALEENIELPDGAELVLDLEERKISGGYNWCFIFVDHSTRTLFWIQDFDASRDSEVQELTCERVPSHLKHLIEGRYWYIFVHPCFSTLSHVLRFRQHMEMFPYPHEIPADAFDQLIGIIMYANIGAMTSVTTTALYSSDELHRMLGLVKKAKSLRDSAYTTALVGRLMYTFAHQRYLDFHGQPHARMSRDQSVYGELKSRTPLIYILSPIFFNAPKVHLRGLEKIWVDGVIAFLPWSHFIGKLQNEWQEFILYSTVLLNANVAFLAIPSVDNDNGNRTPAQISSYLSIVTSIGSIILGLLLVRQHRVKPKDTAADAVTFLVTRRHPTLGLETLAIIYSLPYALLMWGMITFLLAFSFECFFGTHDAPAIYMTATAWIAVAILIVWCIYTAWEGSEVSAQAVILDMLTRISSNAREKVGKARLWGAFRPNCTEPSAAAPGRGEV
ncbi:hypothetical protein A0H81_12483 [Grifola frondosa]|uniref:Uncharacterized protein n=1 Tax=Grifola frondosa TaxID=5627 RepID=A0A1C7LTD2_GRIFR|nr:hypothetical protein A0H81_12483 [Grifola frondosa]